jgi:hypothetical protein
LYNKLYAVVRWNGCVSDRFSLRAGVRQGGVLSPILFNLYVNDLIVQLEECDLGCHVGKKIYGCIMYADDILIMSPSVVELQSMLDLCYKFSLMNDISFNASKCVCLKIGRKCNSIIADMNIGQRTVCWVTTFKYLGISFLAGETLQFDCSYVKKKFYGAFNGLMRGCNSAAENVKVFLTKTFCLPTLTYSIGALQLSSNVIKSVAVCWNDAFRKMFGLNRWESVSCVQYFFNELSFAYLYDLCRWNFLYNCSQSCAPVSHLFSISNLEHGELQKLAVLYGAECSSSYLRKNAVMKHFQAYCMP